MPHEFSNFGQHLGCGSGILELMQDLGHALTTGGPHIKMLGGGQPARIDAVHEAWSNRISQITNEPGGLERSLTTYDPPKGNPHFIEAIASYFQSTQDWPITTDHIAITNGGQTAFFYLFNTLAGISPTSDQPRKILLPIAPEYIGYANQGIDGNLFHSVPPLIHQISEHEFKYGVDFDQIKITPDIAAICCSRPTNPTGNVLTDEEIQRLSDIAKQHDIPLIIDNAYGDPFPGIIFSDTKPFWEPHVILTYSLSKIGLPGTRTGIVIAPPPIIDAISSINAIVGLANANIGQQILLPLIQSGELHSLCHQHIRPFYQEKCDLARSAVSEIFQSDFPWAIHRAEGALFLWLWFPNLPITTKELYQRLKNRDVLIVPGEYFFFGLDDDNWRHRHECIRISYAMDEAVVREGLSIIAEEIRSLYHS